MAERLIALVLKTSIGASLSGVQIPLPPPFELIYTADCYVNSTERFIYSQKWNTTK